MATPPTPESKKPDSAREAHSGRKGIGLMPLLLGLGLAVVVAVALVMNFSSDDEGVAVTGGPAEDAQQADDTTAADSDAATATAVPAQTEDEADETATATAMAETDTTQDGTVPEISPGAPFAMIA